MKKIINNLPKLTNQQQKQKEEYCNNCSTINSFIVDKCPYSDGFTGMGISDLKNLGSNFTPENMNKESFVQLSAFSNLIQKEEEPKKTVKNLPNIHGINKDTDNDVKEEEDKSLFEPDTLTKIYAGSLSLIGLFILFRVVKKTM